MIFSPPWMEDQDGQEQEPHDSKCNKHSLGIIFQYHRKKAPEYEIKNSGKLTNFYMFSHVFAAEFYFMFLGPWGSQHCDQANRLSSLCRDQVTGGGSCGAAFPKEVERVEIPSLKLTVRP